MRFWNERVIGTCEKMSMPMARFAIFVIYAWFGALKVVGLSPADPLVEALLQRTMPFMSFDVFIVLFGLFEVVIGILFLFKRADKIAIPLFVLHMITTSALLVMLPQETWSGVLVPTLEGQYVIKNIALVALVVSLASCLPARKES